MDSPLAVSSSPHIRGTENTRTIMLDVCIALIFPLFFSIYYFELKALYLALLSVISCVVFEFLYRKLLKKTTTVGDLSAVVTGLLLAMTLPVSTPYWAIVAGAFFAIVIAKQLYGGLGKNFINPALAGRAFMVISFSAYVSNWTAPTYIDSSFSLLGVTDAVTTATPLNFLKSGVLPTDLSLQNLLFGEMAGSLGETSAIMLLLGGVYLVVRRVISPRIPLCFLGTVAVMTFIFHPEGVAGLDFMLYSLLSGGLILGAVFMATDYTTSPVTPLGQIIYAVGCGLLTVFIRFFGALPEGVGFAIMFMNICVWLIDKIGSPRRFGVKLFKR